MPFILIHNSAIPLCLTKVTDEFTGLENINNFIIWTRFNIHFKKSMPLGEKTMYTSLWKIVFTQVVGADCTVTVVALLVVASTIFKAFLAASTIFKDFLAALLQAFKINWPKRLLLIWPPPCSVTYSNCQDCCQIFSLLRFISLFWGGISIKSSLFRIVTKIVARDFSEILTDTL